ncbi:exodeoxyribonuclease V subunit beta [Gramella sp. KN1008]|uniref:UvrD-helicase domain-containing protein n=1 Tax=Gramella sp. KN1008 TaxID=2529298 RepID=UPI0010403AD9|nr:UvrD-helicase domain-containing protein [Gramella sp. KN1008]TBW27028.1 DNA helicase UvrD [Gramella sp. KN1008]
MKNSFNIYNASAGSGKTFTLVKEYLSLLFTSPKVDRYKNILAITFTNKAVAEMKKRIIKSLAEFSSSESDLRDHALINAIMQDTGLSIDEIRKKSEEILKSIIHNYAAFEISTIDGFTHRVLRTFARDLGIPLNFEVELDAEQILLQAVDGLVSRAGSDEKLTRILVAFTLAKTDDDKSWDISRDLFNISKLLINENHHKAIQVLRSRTLDDFEKFGKNLNSDIKETENNLKSSANLFFELIENNGIQENDFTRGSIPSHFHKLRTGNASVNFNTKWAENIEDQPLYPKKTDENTKAAIDAIQPTIADIFKTTRQAFFRIEYLKEIKKNLVQLSLLNEINREVEAIKKERNLVLISEFNPKISEQVKDQPAPFIYERLGERYRHYFIDEFQDTSIMQWENLIPLIGNKLDSADESGLTIVGDAKQSIYRWRGGRAEQLIELCNGKTRPFQITPNVVNLPDNFRSGSEIVTFNNDFFNFAASMLTFPDYSDLFKASRQNPKKGNFGYVNISFLEAKNKEEEFELYPKRILQIILDLYKKGFNLNDLCILTRRRSEGVAIAEYLTENDISVISSETLLLAQSPEVMFIIDLLYFSMNQKDDQLKLSIYDYLAEKYLKEDEIHQLLLLNLPKNGNDFFDWLIPYEVEFQLSIIKKLSIYESVEYIIRSFNLVESSNAYIQFFLDFVFETSQKTANSLNDFLEKWEQKKDRLSIVVPEADTAVQIMTIHKSKGLEFPVVIYPFANSDLQDTRNDNIWLETNDENIPVAYVSASQKMLNWNEQAAQEYQDLIYKNELDTLNVLYVACTRASQQLYLLSNYREKPKNAPNIPDMLINYLKSRAKWTGDLSYEFGDPSVILPSMVTHSFAPSKFHSSSTQNEAVQIVTRAGSLWDSRQQEAIEKGEIAHQILARINESGDLKKAVEWAVNTGIITENDKTEINKLISSVLTHPSLEQYYKPGVRNINEKELITAQGERLRPDRINFEGDNTILIDYKTGGSVEKHVQQISTYATALRDMGYQVQKCLLIYISEQLVIKEV